MLVAHQDDHITHAVIGSKQTINFGISDDPAFFQILSSSLYKNPTLAMVRETICNAWDSHIDNEITDKPIEITLDSNSLIIKDYGKGIPHDLIGPIYGIYGASTKKNDGRQTGGFGLGCKSPFAYTDHFEVTSCNEGTKTIYNMSKSSAEVGGKPSINTIVSFPTTESGLTVKIPIKDTDHGSVEKLSIYIKEVVFNGDIKAIFNGESLPTIGLKGSDINAAIYYDYSVINVQYGNVIYEIENYPEYNDVFNSLYTILKNYNSSVVLLAEPDTLSIAPSRENLTYSDLTIKTIKQLLTNFTTHFIGNKNKFNNEIKNKTKELITSFAKSERPLNEKIEISTWRPPAVKYAFDETKHKVFSTKESLIFYFVIMDYFNKKSIKPKVWLKNTGQMLFNMEDKFYNRGLVQSWYRFARKHIKHLDNRFNYNFKTIDSKLATLWWQKKVLYPFIKKMNNTIPNFDKQKLHIISNISEKTEVSLKFQESHTQNLIYLLKPTLIISHNNSTLKNRLAYLDNKKYEGTFSKGTYFSYSIPRKTKETEEIIKRLKELNDVEIIDLTKRLPHEQQAYELRKTNREKTTSRIKTKKKTDELVRLDSLFGSDKLINTKRLLNSNDLLYIENPEFIVKVSMVNSQISRIENLFTNLSHKIAKLYGNKGAVTNRQNIYDKYIAKGVKSLNEYVIEKLANDMLTDPALLNYHSQSDTKIDNYLKEKGINKNFIFREFIQWYVDILKLNVKNLTPELQDKIYIWTNINHLSILNMCDKLQDTQHQIKQIPLDPKIVDSISKSLNNKLFMMLDIYGTNELLDKYENEPEIREKIFSIINIIVE